MMSLTRPLRILIKGTHFLRGNPEGTHAELKGNPVIRIIPNIYDYSRELLAPCEQKKGERPIPFSTKAHYLSWNAFLEEK